MSIISWIIQIVLGLFGLSKKPQPTVEAQATGRAAAAEVVSQVDTATASKQAAIAQAEADAPKDQGAVSKTLNEGKF